MTAVLGRDRHTQPAAVGDGPVELSRKLVRLILFHPVLIVEFARQLGDRLADQLLVFGQLEIHSTAGHCWISLAQFMHRRTGVPVACQSLLPVSAFALAVKSAIDEPDLVSL